MRKPLPALVHLSHVSREQPNISGWEYANSGTFKTQTILYYYFVYIFEPKLKQKDSWCCYVCWRRRCKIRCVYPRANPASNHRRTRIYISPAAAAKAAHDASSSSSMMMKVFTRMVAYRQNRRTIPSALPNWLKAQKMSLFLFASKIKI